MHLNRQQFDVAIPGALVVVLLAVAFISLPLVVPFAVVGGVVVGLLFAIRDGADHA